MSESKGPSRRRMLASLGVVAGGAAVGVTGPAGTALAASGASAIPRARTWSGNTTQNGWPVVGSKGFKGCKIEGSNAVVALSPGDAATVLMYVVRRFHYEIRSLKSGDVFGYTTDHTVLAPFESNYLSGSAIAVLPGLYPAGSAGNLFPNELAVVRDILAECQGVVRWGGDDKGSPKEGHFQIDVRPGSAQLKSVVAKLTAWQGTPGQGAGAPGDLSSTSRRAAAQTLERKQRAA
ncbi:hypothetical protein [Streptacidiphilus sp. EB129]|jgi:hypothetical protein|uniref:hypothetical protein n=1 Tax=Streptacidiphilus sp. EB129 TaxID=3156262 RepID=UPI003511C26C